MTQPIAGTGEFSPSLREQEQMRRAMRGVVVYPVRTLAASQTLSRADAFVVGDTTSAGITLTLPPVAEMAGRMLWVIKAVAANTLTLQGNSTDTINGSNTLAWSTQYQTYTLLSDGTVWWIV